MTYPSLKKSAFATIIIIAVVAACVLVYRYNPIETTWMPKCMWHTLTGYDCPSCGSTRAMHCFLHGDIAGGLRYNWFVLYSWPYFLFVALYEILRPRKMRPRWYWHLAYLYIALYLLWWLLRNLLSL